MPASIQLVASPLAVNCDQRDYTSLMVRVTDAAGNAVPDGTVVTFSALGGRVPGHGVTHDGIAKTVAVFGSAFYDPTRPNLLVQSGPLLAGLRISCAGATDCVVSPPPSDGDVCATPTAYVPPLATDTATATAPSTTTPTATPTVTGTPTPTATASRTASATRTAVAAGTVVPARTPPLPRCADVNGDGRVNWRDLLVETNAVARHSGKMRYDLNGDGSVDARDLRVVVRHLGRRC